MITNNMDLKEVEAVIARDYQKILPRIVGKLRDVKYRRYLLKNKTNDNIVFFPSFELKAFDLSSITFTIIPDCKGWNHFKKYGLCFIVYCRFRWKGNTHYAMHCFLKHCFIFYSYHLIQRYSERQLGLNGFVDKNVVEEFFKHNHQFFSEKQYEGKHKGELATGTKQGLIYGDLILNRIKYFKTFVPTSMLYENQLEDKNEYAQKIEEYNKTSKSF